jgi:hypothetical protein
VTIRPRHAAALALLGRTLLIPEVGKTIPKGCLDCFVSLEAQARIGPEFKTKGQCEKAGNDWVRDFYVTAQKNDAQVVFPPKKPQCIEHMPK